MEIKYASLAVWLGCARRVERITCNVSCCSSKKHLALYMLRLRSWSLVPEEIFETTLLTPAQANSKLMPVLDLFLCNVELSSVQNSEFCKKLSKRSQNFCLKRGCRNYLHRQYGHKTLLELDYADECAGPICMTPARLSQLALTTMDATRVLLGEK